MSETERTSIPLHPLGLPSILAVPEQPGAALAVMGTSEPGKTGVPAVVWRAAPGFPIAWANPPFDISSGILLGGYSSITSSQTRGEIAIGGPGAVVQYDARTLAPLAAWIPPEPGRAEAIAYSPDGRFMAVANGNEQVSLVPLAKIGERGALPIDAGIYDLRRGTPSGVMSGGEYTGCLTFTTDGAMLIAGCSFEGGASLSLAEVGKGSESGALLNLRELDLRDNLTPLAEFCDNVISLAVSPNGRALALFETAQTGSQGKAPGWQGIVSVADFPFETLRWSTSITAQITGDARPIEAFHARNGGGYHTKLAFVSDDEVVCGASAGNVLVFDAHTGALRRKINLPEPYRRADVWRIAPGAARELWCTIILEDDSYQLLCLDTTPQATHTA